jgi:hypothetical protein
METKIISFSGGRSSGMMLKIMQDNALIDSNTHVIFANTGKEHEETLKFVDECSKRWSIPVVWLEYIDTAPFYKVVTFETAARNGEPFEAILRKRKNKYLPNLFRRLCTEDMKVKTIHRYVKNTLKAKQYLTYLGIRADEPKRIARMREHTEMPLVGFKVTKADVKRFWESQSFDLIVPGGFGNCDLCFMKSNGYAGRIVQLIRQEPERADWWIEQERKTGATFMKGITYEQLKYIALSQKEFSFDDEPEIDCFCGG